MKNLNKQALVGLLRLVISLGVFLFLPAWTFHYWQAWIFKENSFTSAIIEIGDKQRLITTGPYALVRHPMYSGALVMLLGMPPALGSWWGLLTIIPMGLVIVWRLLAEEKFLAQNLPGYGEYQNKVRHRLLPGVW